MDDGRKARLHIGHIVDRDHGGATELGNLRALCSACNQGTKNIAQEPPSWTWLMAQVRRATVSDQRKVLEWLTKSSAGKATRDAAICAGAPAQLPARQGRTGRPHKHPQAGWVSPDAG